MALNQVHARREIVEARICALIAKAATKADWAEITRIEDAELVPLLAASIVR